MSDATPGIWHAPDGKPRCSWAGGTDMLAYHDHEWGFPVTDDRRLFEKLCLEGFQSGLSWRTILNKRENFRAAFSDFDPAAVASFGADDVARLLLDAGIVRHRGKIEAAIANAKATVAVQATEGSLAALVWPFEPPGQAPQTPLPAHSQTSKALARELKRRGFKFVGPTTVYAFMQAMGLVNDHHPECIVRPRVEAARRKLERPR